MPDQFAFAVQANPTWGADWTQLCRTIERAGFAALCVPDHPGSTLSPFVALGMAAAATETVGLGTAVVNLGVRDPFAVAADAATLDRLAGGRAELGVGAGHTPREWSAIGREYPSARHRVERLVEAVPLLRRLLAGDTVDHEGRHFRMRGARLDQPSVHPVPILVGGNRVLARRLAAVADVVELSGLGPTLPDGHFHQIRWSTTDVDVLVAAFHDGAGTRPTQLGALVQRVAVTDDAEGTATRFLADVGARLAPETLPEVDELLAAPFVLIGTPREIVEKLMAARARWGFTRYTVRADALDAMADVLTRLRDRDELAGPGTTR